MPLKIGETNVTNLLRNEYKKLGKGWITLMIVSTEKSFDVNVEALRILIDEMNYNGIYITLNKTYSEIAALLAENGIDIEKLYFVDAISQMYGKPMKATKRCQYVSGPLNIDAITSAIYNLIPQILGENKFVFLDSITTILLYNAMPRTLRFSQFLTEKLKKMEINGVMVSVIKGVTEEKLIEELSKLCDEVIEIHE